MKKEYKQGTPEWTLSEAMKGSEAAARAWQDDVERYQQKATAARDNASLYRAALAKLDPSFSA